MKVCEPTLGYLGKVRDRNMSGFREFDNFLKQECGDDFWADDAVLRANALASLMSGEDWVTLRTVWQQRSSKWQLRCADVLSGVAPIYAVPILAEMAEKGERVVAIGAAESLESMVRGDVAIPETVMKRLEKLCDQCSEFDRKTIKSLMAALQRG